MFRQRSIIILGLTMIGFFSIIEGPSLWSFYVGNLPEPEKIHDTIRSAKQTVSLTDDELAELRTSCQRTTLKLRMKLCESLPPN